jgi:hypothetical protein
MISKNECEAPPKVLPTDEAETQVLSEYELNSIAGGTPADSSITYGGWNRIKN